MYIIQSDRTLYSMKLLAGVPGVARDDQWRNRIAILCIIQVYLYNEKVET